MLRVYSPELIVIVIKIYTNIAECENIKTIWFYANPFRSNFRVDT